jgi:hypothetical protein
VRLSPELAIPEKDGHNISFFESRSGDDFNVALVQNHELKMFGRWYGSSRFE